MTQVCCPSCRLRFNRAAAAYLVSCPQCGAPLLPVATEHVLGFQLLTDDDRSETLPHAIAVALPVDRPGSDPT